MATEANITSNDLIRLVREANQRTLDFVADLNDSQLDVAPGKDLNPFLWLLGHVSFFYDTFLLRELDGSELLMKRGNEIYDSFEVNPEDRWDLDYLDREGTLRYVAEIGKRAVERLRDHEPTERERYLYRLAVQHEDMHGEAFAYMRHSLALPAPQFVRKGRDMTRKNAGALLGDVEVPGGKFLLGAAPGVSFAYDNEKWAHEVELESFRIARAPVTVEEFRAFVADGGYTRRELWSRSGWIWRKRCGAQHPRFWQRDGTNWLCQSFDEVVPLALHHPASHVNWYEAEAFCAWAQRRLPTEAEWERAASTTATPKDTTKRRFAWGDHEPTAHHANLGCWLGGTLDVADLEEGESDFGCRQMIGNVWEWTASDFYPFPGFILDQPYKEYSAPWFGDRKVLRGGCWATQPSLAYNTYRNFFEPHRNEIFAGFRTCTI